MCVAPLYAFTRLKVSLVLHATYVHSVSAAICVCVRDRLLVASPSSQRSLAGHYSRWKFCHDIVMLRLRKRPVQAETCTPRASQTNALRIDGERATKRLLRWSSYLDSQQSRHICLSKTMCCLLGGSLAGQTPLLETPWL